MSAYISDRTLVVAQDCIERRIREVWQYIEPNNAIDPDFRRMLECEYAALKHALEEVTSGLVGA